MDCNVIHSILIVAKNRRDTAESEHSEVSQGREWLCQGALKTIRNMLNAMFKECSYTSKDDRERESTCGSTELRFRRQKLRV